MLFPLNSLTQDFFSDKTLFVVLIPNNFQLHPKLSTCVYIYVYILEKGNEYLFDGTSIQDVIPYLKNSKSVLIYDKKSSLYTSTLLNDPCIKDVHGVGYCYNSYKYKHLQLDSFYTNTWTVHKHDEEYAHIVPKSIHLKLCRLFVLTVLREIKSIKQGQLVGYTDFDKKLITLFEIERNGLYFDVDCKKTNTYFKDKDVSHHIDNTNLLYSHYNVYNHTGRPSNSYNSINFLALDKSTDSREIFTSRFGSNGVLLQIDFKAHHICIIKELLKYPKKINHDLLLKTYFNTDTITEELYTESKDITFQNLYSTAPIKLAGEYTDFFESTRLLINEVYNEFNVHNYYTTPYSKFQFKLSKDVKRNQVFNYFIQSTEAELMLQRLHKINKKLENYNTKCVLFVYDSFLLDLDLAETKEVMNIIKDVCRGLPIHAHFGRDYKNLKEIKK